MDKSANKLFFLAGKVVIVTKTAQELGTIIIEGLAQSGAIVCGSGESQTLQCSSVNQVNKQPENPPNKYNSAPFEFLCAELISRYGKCDLLINTAAITFPSKLNNLNLPTVDGFQKAIDFNLEIAMKYIQGFAENSTYTKNSSIINVISIQNAVGFPENFGYIAVKNALITMTRKIAKITNQSVSVNNIVVGYQTQDISNQKSIKQMNLQQYQELLEAIVFLISDRSERLTGEDIFIIDDLVLTSIGSP